MSELTISIEQVVKIKSAAEALLIVAKKVGGSTEAAAQVLQLCETVRSLAVENERLKAELTALRAEVALMKCQIKVELDFGDQYGGVSYPACGTCLPCRERARLAKEKADE